MKPSLGHKKQTKLIEQFVREKMSDIPDPHGIKHVEDVVGIAQKIGTKLKISDKDKIQLEAAAWLHDIGRKKEFSIPGAKSNHAKFSAEEGKLFLSTISFPSEEADKIVEAVLEHSNREPSTTLIGKILQDADKLSRLTGRGGLIAAIQFTVAREPNELLDNLSEERLPDWRTEEFEKLLSILNFNLEWFEMLSFNESKEMCRQGYMDLKAYCDQIQDLLNKRN